MKKLSSSEIRKMWLTFFEGKKHHVVESCSLIPVNDPSLLWINSGVATLKPYFDGRKTPPANRLTNSQKSIRTNDIENVGFTARHHTLFEMLGNFSIGDYFKEDAIKFAWEFLTSKKWLGLDKQKLYITVYQEDQEAYHLWRDVIGVSEEHIIKGTKDTNFWEIGEGPCGPNSEIFYDRGLKYDQNNIGIKLLKDDMENDRYLEIWNIVFSQFNHKADGSYEELPRKNIDTGAGLERITSVLQETPTNFETDLFLPIIREMEKMIDSTHTYDPNNFFTEEAPQKMINTAFKIIADHIRAVTFAIADGAFPSNKDRGYVIRRLIRRASLYGQKLGMDKPFLYKLVDVVIMVMGDFYSYLSAKRAIIMQTVRDEEEKFLKTLVQGYQLFNEYKDTYHKIDKDHAFRLFETYGFPIELIVEEARNANVPVDEAGFYELLTFHKDLSRQSRKNIKAMYQQNELFTKLDVPSKFIGYECEESKSKVVFMFADDKAIDHITDGECFVILNETPFYAEKGGQVGDNGTLNSTHCVANVIDVQQGPKKQHIHQVQVKGTLKLNDDVFAQINKDKRFYTRKNHSGTHLLHASLRAVLGNHVMQIGSYNDEDRLRIDINHNEPISAEQISAIESLVVAEINRKIPCEIIYTDYPTAVEKYHALAFFAEKYDKEVRVVRFGEFSCELCGGTHCTNSHEVEDLMITSIESKGANSFRVHAITSHKMVAEYLRDTVIKLQNDVAVEIEQYWKDKQASTMHDGRIEQLIEDIQSLSISKENARNGKNLINELKDQLRKFNQDVLTQKEENIIAQLPSVAPIDINGCAVYVCGFDQSPSVLKKVSDIYMNQHQGSVVFFYNLDNPGHRFVCASNVAEKFAVGDFIKQALSKMPECNVKGGGNKNFGQGEIASALSREKLHAAIVSLIQTKL